MAEAEGEKLKDWHAEMRKGGGGRIADGW